MKRLWALSICVYACVRAYVCLCVCVGPCVTVVHMLSRVCVYGHDNVHAYMSACACASVTYPGGFSSLSPGDTGREDADTVVSMCPFVGASACVRACERVRVCVCLRASLKET